MTEDAVNIVFCPSFFFYYSFLRGGEWMVSPPSLLIPFPPTSSPGPLPSPLSLPAITFLYFFLFFLYGIYTSCCSFFCLLSSLFTLYFTFASPVIQFVLLFLFLSVPSPYHYVFLPFSLTSPFFKPFFCVSSHPETFP